METTVKDGNKSDQKSKTESISLSCSSYALYPAKKTFKFDGVPQGVSKLPLNFGIKKTGNQISDSMSLYDHEL